MCPWVQSGKRRCDVCASRRRYSTEVKGMDLTVQLSRVKYLWHCLPVSDLSFFIWKKEVAILVNLMEGLLRKSNENTWEVLSMVRTTNRCYFHIMTMNCEQISWGIPQAKLLSFKQTVSMNVDH